MDDQGANRRSLRTELAMEDLRGVDCVSLGLGTLAPSKTMHLPPGLWPWRRDGKRMLPGRGGAACPVGLRPAAVTHSWVLFPKCNRMAFRPGHFSGKVKPREFSLHQ